MTLNTDADEHYPGTFKKTNQNTVCRYFCYYSIGSFVFMLLQSFLASTTCLH